MYEYEYVFDTSMSKLQIASFRKIGVKDQFILRLTNEEREQSNEANLSINWLLLHFKKFNDFEESCRVNTELLYATQH